MESYVTVIATCFERSRRDIENQDVTVDIAEEGEVGFRPATLNTMLPLRILDMISEGASGVIARP